MNKKKAKGHQYYQGTFVPENPDKYKGKLNNIIFRSSWEKLVMIYLDTTTGVLQWNSEELVIPYTCEVDGKRHRYFIDFWCRVQKSDGSISDMALEVKPEAQTKPPRRGKTERAYLNRLRVYIKNQSKWKAAKEFCESHNMEFQIITEKTLKL